MTGTAAGSTADSAAGPPSGPSSLWHRWRVALQFLTRIPVRVDASGEDDIRRSLVFFPIVGAVVAGVGIAVRAGLGPVVGAAPATVAAVAATVAVTGAFHEDGLADSADGLWGGWTPERRVEIMRDSRVGTYGAITLVLALLYQTALLAPLPLGPFAAVFVTGHVVGRAGGVALAALLPPVSDQGLGARAVGPTGATTALGCLATVAVTTVAAARQWFWIPAIAAIAAVAAVRSVARSKIGGSTGDILGAANQLAMLAAMSAVAALVRAGLL